MEDEDIVRVYIEDQVSGKGGWFTAIFYEDEVKRKLCAIDGVQEEKMDLRVVSIYPDEIDVTGKSFNEINELCFLYLEMPSSYRRDAHLLVENFFDDWEDFLKDYGKLVFGQNVRNFKELGRFLIKENFVEDVNEKKLDPFIVGAEFAENRLVVFGEEGAYWNYW